MSQHYLIRVGDGKNFIRSTKSQIWGLKSTASYGKGFLSNAKEGDTLWFVKNKTKGQLIAVATYVSHNRREFGPLVNLTPSNAELGWTGDKADDFDIEIHYTSLYDLTDCNLMSNIQGQQTIRKFGSGCCIDLPNEYIYIARYRKPVSQLQEQEEVPKKRRPRVKFLSAPLPKYEDLLAPRLCPKTSKDDIDIGKEKAETKKRISENVKKIVEEVRREKKQKVDAALKVTEPVTEPVTVPEPEPEPEPVKTSSVYKKFTALNGKTYLTSRESGLIYDYTVYKEKKELDVIGKWIGKGKCLWLKKN